MDAATGSTACIFGEHTIFALEVYEITPFAVYWTLHTIERWDEDVVTTKRGAAEAAVP